MKIIFITASLLLFSEFLFGQGDKEFFDAIRSLEGKTYYGKALYMPDTTKANDFWGKKLSFKVNGSNKSKLKLPFNVGENQTRTWEGFLWIVHQLPFLRLKPNLRKNLKI
jgi:hypothetical protein